MAASKVILGALCLAAVGPSTVVAFVKSPMAAELRQQRLGSLSTGATSSAQFCLKDFCLDNNFPALFRRVAPATAQHAHRHFVQGEGAVEFKFSSVVHNNLGNQGPDGGEALLRFENITTVGDQVVNLVVTASSPFSSPLSKRTGESNHWGIINFACDTGANLLFSFRDSETHEDVTIERFYFSVISAGVSADTTSTYVSFNGSLSSYFTAENAVWKKSESSTKWTTPLGVNADIPADPLNLSPDEMAKTFTGQFDKVSQFEAGLGVQPTKGSSCDADTGRNIMFGFKTNLVGAVNPVSVSTTTTTTPPCLSLDIGKATIKHNNLAGDNNSFDNAETLHLAGVAKVGDIDIDLVITATEGFKSNSLDADGIFHDFGRLNMMCGTTAQLTFRFVDSSNGEAVSIDRLCWSFADLDTGIDGKCSESVTLGGFDSYYLAQGSELSAKDADDGTTTFTASKHGTGADNPEDPVAMSALQAGRAVGFVFNDVSIVQATIAVSDGPVKRGRNVMFAGGSVVAK